MFEFTATAENDIIKDFSDGDVVKLYLRDGIDEADYTFANKKLTWGSVEITFETGTFHITTYLMINII